MVQIPKIMHFIWLGRSPLHPLMVEWLGEWRSLNPTWMVLLWQDLPTSSGVYSVLLGHELPASRGVYSVDLSLQEPIEVRSRILRSEHGDLIVRACHLSQRSNIWRYEIVRKLGGLYIDTDVEPIRPIDELVDGKQAFAASYLRESGHYTCSFFGAVPQHPWVCHLVAGLSERDPSISLSMGSAYFSEKTALHPEVEILPGIAVLNDHNPWFQPPGLVPQAKADRRSANPDTYAIHHWSSNWYRKGFEPLGQ